MATLPLNNAATPLTTPTHEGSGEGLHPHIIDFLTEYNMASWVGYRYWMIFTPYPNSDNANEDPNLLASNDGQVFVVPSGIVNPLADALGGASGFNSDPELVYNPDTNELWLYYRFVDSNYYIRLIKISENMECTAPIDIITITAYVESDVKSRSLCIWRESSSKWHMWGGGGIRPYKVYYSFSNDGTNWGEFTQCLNSDGLDPFQVIGYENWHMDCKPNCRENKVEFLNYCWVLDGGDTSLAKVLNSSCNVDNPTLLLMPITSPILQVGSGWDNGCLYRSTFVIENDTINKKYIFKIWYSAKSSTGEWHIGYTEGDVGTNYSIIKEFVRFEHESIIDLPLFELDDVEDNRLRIKTAEGIRCIKLVDITDNNATKIRILTATGIKALASR
jgi:hypothetical protein